MSTKTFLLVALLVGALVLLGAGAPPVGWTTTCRVIDVYDGDTITVEVTKRLKVRLLDCWAPEVRGATRAEGIAARDSLRAIALEQQAVLHIPSHTEGEIWRLWTFGRVLGRVWVRGGDQSLSEQMVAAGHASRGKP